MSSDFELKTALFKELLNRWNKIHNLTNHKNIDSVIADSVFPILSGDGVSQNYKYIKTAIDIGSGAGFPAIFLAILMEGTQFFLFEPAYKKASFLSVVISELKLKNVKVCPQKIQLHNPKFRADLITSRALMSALNIAKIAAGFYNKNTQFLLYKGSGANAEASELKSHFKNAKIELLNGSKDGFKERVFMRIYDLKEDL